MPSRLSFSSVTLTAAFAVAVIASLFFHGFNLDYFSLVQALLLLWLAWVLWQGYEGLHVPKTALALSLTLFWAWSALTLLWTQVPAVSTLNFWWVGSLPLAFWLYTLSPDRDRLWLGMAAFAVLLGIGLALMGVYQLHVQQVHPRSVFININSHAALLNLIVLPLCAAFVLKFADRRWAWSLGVIIFVFVYALAITRGRAAMASFALSFGLLFLLIPGGQRRKAFLMLLAPIAAALVLANVSVKGEVVERLATLGDPTGAGATRWVIWQAAWDMIKDQPWWGRGLGTFALSYPAYRDPTDSSAGYYVHNDYLQIWIEAGLPGLLLFAAVWLSLAWMMWRVWRSRGSAATKIEIAGLFAGLFAIALHSLFDFNFYQISMLLIGGVMLARVQSLFARLEAVPVVVVQPRRVFGRPGFRTLVVLLALFPILYFLSTALATFEYRSALAQADAGEWLAAEEHLHKASRFAPAGDSIGMTRGDLFRRAMLLAPDISEANKRALYEASLQSLAAAERANPLRAEIFLIRAGLFAENANLAGGDGLTQARAQYERAIALNPRYFAARQAYAEFLLQQNEPAVARRVLEEGLRYWHTPSEYMVPYYGLTARLLREAGEIEQGRRLERRIEAILLARGWRRTAGTGPGEKR